MKILVVRLDHMGDIVLTVPPIVSSLRAVYPDADIEVLTTFAGVQLLQDDSNIDRLTGFDPPWSVPGKGAKLVYISRCMMFAAKRLYSAGIRYDVILFLSFSPWEKFLIAWQGKLRAGFSGPYGRPIFRLSRRLLNCSIPFNPKRHTLDNGFDLLQKVFPRTDRQAVTELKVSGKRALRGRELLSSLGEDGGPIVVFHAGTDKSMKTWPFLKYVDVAESLSREFHARCVFVGTSSEVEYYKEESVRAGKPIPLTCVTASIDQLVSVAANADVFVANDGGPMHIAAALCVPTIAVFGPTDERVFGPKGAFSRVVREPGICGRQQYPWQVSLCCGKKGKECLYGIRVESVLNMARSVLLYETRHSVKASSYVVCEEH